MDSVVWAIAAASVAAPVFAAEPARARHLIYLHGRIVQVEQSARPVHPRFGPYELDEVLRAFRDRGFAVTGEIRARDASVESAAERVVDEVRSLLAAGTPPERITVVGASMGASIALLAATRLQEPGLRYATLGACLSANVRHLVAEEGRAPAGRVLSIREASDEITEPCPAWSDAEGAAPSLVAREILLDTGLAHGFFYRPRPVWVDPVADWAAAP